MSCFATDWAPGGMEAHDAVEVARMAVAAGADIVDVSAGQTVPEAKPVPSGIVERIAPWGEQDRLDGGEGPADSWAHAGS